MIGAALRRAEKEKGHRAPLTTPFKVVRKRELAPAEQKSVKNACTELHQARARAHHALESRSLNERARNAPNAQCAQQLYCRRAQETLLLGVI